MSLATFPLHYTCAEGRYFVADEVASGGVQVYRGVREADGRALLITDVRPRKLDQLIASITYDVPGTTKLLAVTRGDVGSWRPPAGAELDEPCAESDEDLPEGFVLVVETRPSGVPLRLLGPREPRLAVQIGVGLLFTVSAAVDQNVFLGGIRPDTVYADPAGYAGVHARLWAMASSPWPPGRLADLFPPGGFFAPEILWSDPPTPTSDAFAAAAVLWWFATGCDPFGEPDEQHQRIIDGQLDPFRGPPELGEILVPMLGRDPAARPSAAESADRLAALARRWDVPVAPFPPPGLDE